jgi:hypothetical protein
MTWIRLEGRHPLPRRSIGLTGAATCSMIAAHFNVAETYVLPSVAYRHTVSGVKMLNEARQAVQCYDFAADAHAFAQLMDSAGPDVLVRCSPVVPRAWTWFPLEAFDAAIVVHGTGDLNAAIRQSWLLLLDASVFQSAREAGMTEARYLAAVSMALLAQSADLHPGLSGRAWSPNGDLGEPHAVVRCSLGTTETDDSVWEWAVSTSHDIMRRPSPSPADERPIIQAASLATQLGNRISMSCVLDWTWDGQALTFLAARPVFVHPGTRVFSRQALARLAPRALTPMAAAILTDLLRNLVQDADTMLLGTRAPLVPDDVARTFDGCVYLDESFTRNVLTRAGLPRDMLEDLLLQRRGDTARFSVQMLARLTRSTHAAVAVRLAVPRFERWISDNASLLAQLDELPTSISSVDEGLAQLQQLISFVRPLLLNLILLLASSSFRVRDLERALGRHGIQDRLEEALTAASDTAGLDPWTHLDRIAAKVSDENAARAAEALAARDPDRATSLLCADTTVERDVDAFIRTFSFFRTAIIDVGSPTLRERGDVLPAALLRARETGAAARVAAADDPNAWLDALPVGSDAILKKRYHAMMRTSAVTEKAWFYLAKSLSRARLILLCIGELLVASGRLDNRNDVLLLEPGELTQEADLQSVVTERALSQARPTPALEVIVTHGDA